MRNGYFDDNAREYVIENMYPRRPLKNYLWNETMIVELNQFGFGPAQACIDKRFRNVITDERMFYIKDEATGEIFDINRNFAKKSFEKFRTRVGLGYHVIESEYSDIASSVTYLVPQKNYVEMQKFTLVNKGEQERKLSVYTYIHPFVSVTNWLAYGQGKFDEEMKGLHFTYNGFRQGVKYTDIFYGASEKAIAYELMTENFTGTYGSLAEPEALKEELLSCRLPIFDTNFCGALQFRIELQAGEEKELYFAVGTAQNREECLALSAQYVGKDAFEKEFAMQKASNDEYVPKTVINTPDEYFNSMVNIWLKRQMTLGKTWGRVYGKGFRDILQDIAGFVSLDADMARDRLLNAMKYQFISGNALRQFDPVFDYPYQDMPVWVAPTVLTYLKESGDFSILNEVIPYYDDKTEESLFRHLERSVDYILNTQGKRGLSLWGGGDWNDSLDNCGMEMKGEGVWLSIAGVRAAEDFLEILAMTQIPVERAYAENRIVELKEKVKKLKDSIIEFGFDGDHFIYGFNDWDEKVGSDDCKEGKIFLNPQTWAVMSSIISKEEKEKLMDVVEARLKCSYGYLQNIPPYTTPDDHLGRLTYFPAGVYENGSVYVHGAMFKVVADCCIGRGDNAVNTLKMLAYDNPEHNDSGVEPYAITNMYFGPMSIARVGYAPQSWITGSAGWMYRAIVEHIFGVKAEVNGLLIQPCLPSDWADVSITRVYRGATYHIHLKAADKKEVLVDGKAHNSALIPVFEKGSEHIVEFYYTK